MAIGCRADTHMALVFGSARREYAVRLRLKHAIHEYYFLCMLTLYLSVKASRPYHLVVPPSNYASPFFFSNRAPFFTYSHPRI